MSEAIHHRTLQRFIKLAILATMHVFAPLAAAQSVIVKEAWARATAPGQSTASVYLELVSATDAALIGATSPVAKRAEMHAMRVENGVMKMRAVRKIELPARKAVRLAPGALHIMLVGIARPLLANETIPLELTVEIPGATSKVAASVEVRAAAGHHRHPH